MLALKQDVDLADAPDARPGPPDAPHDRRRRAPRGRARGHPRHLEGGASQEDEHPLPAGRARRARRAPRWQGQRASALPHDRHAVWRKCAPSRRRARSCRRSRRSSTRRCRRASRSTRSIRRAAFRVEKRADAKNDCRSCARSSDDLGHERARVRRIDAAPLLRAEQRRGVLGAGPRSSLPGSAGGQAYWRPDVELGFHFSGRHDGFVLGVRQAFDVGRDVYSMGETLVRAGWDFALPFRNGRFELTLRRSRRSASTMSSRTRTPASTRASEWTRSSSSSRSLRLGCAPSSSARRVRQSRPLRAERLLRLQRGRRPRLRVLALAASRFDPPFFQVPGADLAGCLVSELAETERDERGRGSK